MDSYTRPTLEQHAGPPSAVSHDCRVCLELFRAFVKDYASCTLDTHGRVAAWNDGAQRLFGYASDEIMGRHFTTFYTQDDVNADIPQLELGAAHTVGRCESEGWRVRRDGSPFMARSLLAALSDDASELYGYELLIHDVSGQERLEERFRRVVEAAPSAMVEVDAAGLITMVNLQTERMFGYTRAELLGQPIEMLVPERFRPQHPEQRRKFGRAPVSRPMGAGRDLYALRKDGSEFAVEIGLNPMQTEEGTMVLSAIVDISDRKHKEERIQAALAEKDVLLGEIHHRVKNNLQIVHSLLDLQATRIEDPAVLEMLSETQNRIQSMALIHQILYQSRDFSGVDFATFLEDLVPSLAAAYGTEAEHVALNIDATGVLLPLNKAIPCGLIVNELITNSLKHAFPGNRRGRLDILLTGAGADRVRLIVRDDGIGIDAALDLDDSASHGLKLVTLLAEQLHGELRVQRAGPTEFSLSFPVRN